MTCFDMHYFESKLNASLKTGKYSSLFLNQLFNSAYNQIYNINVILDEIKCLEGFDIKSRTKPATQFHYNPLKGLWHKHFTSARQLIKNIGIYWGMEQYNRSGPNNPQHLKKLDNLIQDAIQKYNLKGGGELTDKFFCYLAKELTYRSIQERSKNSKSTGDWIIFARQSNRNYYLSLGQHEESNDEIFRRIEPCFEDFPFLHRLLKFN